MTGKPGFSIKGFPTPSDIPEELDCYNLPVPASSEWAGLVSGAIAALTDERNWYQTVGGILPADAAAAARGLLEAQTDCPVQQDSEAPFWDSANGDNASDDEPVISQPWYDTLGDWIITAFVAVAFTPGAAVTYITTVPKLRFYFRTRNYGAILQVLADGVPVANIDTYSAADGLVSLDVVNPGTTFRIEHTGTHNAAATPLIAGYGIEIVRKRLWAAEISPDDLRVNLANGNIESTSDGGATWTPAPTRDPRKIITALPPSGASAQCDAAYRIVLTLTALELYCENLAQEVETVATVANLVAVLLEPFLPELGVLLELFYQVLAAVAGVGYAALHAAFTSSVWTGIKCIIMCDISPGVALTDAAIADIEAKIATAYPGIVSTVVNYLIGIVGPGGLSAIAGKRTEIGNCTGCTSCAWSFNLTPDNNNGRLHFIDNDWYNCTGVDNYFGHAGDVEAVGGVNVWHSTANTAGNGAVSVEGDITLPAGSTVTRVRMYYIWNGSGLVVRYLRFGGTGYCTQNAGAPSPADTGTISLAGPQVVHLRGYMLRNAPGTDSYIQRFLIEGTGINPLL